MTEAQQDVLPESINEAVSADYSNLRPEDNPLHLLKTERLDDGSTLLTFVTGGTLTVRESIAEIDVVEMHLRAALAPKKAA